ncbi:MAG TPA: cohesin domain-containing protein, partial [Candidatus Syntrophosphaera sp.]|nr:cohesin domain-containing protein [Candidatus Syntrophosphaera sp.]
MSFRRLVLLAFFLIGVLTLLYAESNALQFNASTPNNDYVYIGYNVYNQLFAGASGFSFEGWIKPASLVSGSARNRIINLQIFNGAVALFVGLTQSGKLEIGARSGPTDSYQNVISPSVVVTTNTWYHIAAVVDFTPGSKCIRGYVNGVEVATNTTPSFANSTYVPGVGNTDIIGIHPTPLPSYVDQYIGLMDEFRVWKYPRTQAQIQADRFQELTLPQTGLIGYWKFNETSGTIAYDSSPSAKNGTLINFPAAPWVTGYPLVIRIFIDYPDYTLKYFESATVAVKIEGLPPSKPLRGYKVHLDFDDSFLEVSGLDAFVEGSFLSDVDLTQWYVLEENGGHTVTGSILGYTPGATGSGTLFYVTLKAKDQATGPAGTDVLLSEIILRDPLNHNIYWETLDHCN